METSAPVSGVKVMSEEIEPPTLVLESIPVPESVSFKLDIPVQESLKSLVAEPLPIASKESAVPIIEEPFPQENMALEVEATHPPIDPELTTPTVAPTESKVPSVDSFVEPILFSSFPAITEGTFW